MLKQRLASLWEEFLVELQDAVKHVTQQTPLMIQTLDNKLQVCLVCLPISSLTTGYYYVMICRVQFCHSMSSVRPSLCPSVCP